MLASDEMCCVQLSPECDELGSACAAVPFFDKEAASDFVFFKQIGWALGFARTIPTEGPTQCFFAGESTSMDGGCYSAYVTRGDFPPDVLVTK